jgi:hypothetical protein
VRTPRGQPKKNATLTVTREERCVVDPAELPPDAIRHGTTAVIVQHLCMEAEVIRFVREVWYVPGTRTTITAPLPPGYHGGFILGLRQSGSPSCYPSEEVTKPFRRTRWTSHSRAP